MVDIFNEVEEDLRRDRYQKLWQRYGIWLAAGAVAIVVATGGYSAWRNWQMKQLNAASDSFDAAASLAAGSKNKEAADAFGLLARTAPGGYASLSRFREAAALVAAGDVKAAVATLDQMAGAGGDVALRDLAALKAAALLIDTATPDEIAKRLAPLAEESRPWRLSARELQAAAAIKQGRVDDARAILVKLSEDATSPPGLRTRAGELLSAIGGKPPAAKIEPPADAAPAAASPPSQ